MDLSVIILSYNTKQLLKDCLNSVLASDSKYRTEIFVPDNGSTDGSIEMVRSEFPQVKLIENGSNFGFAKGNNVAIRQATGRHIMLLNSDTVVKPDTFSKMIEKADSDPGIGALGPKILLRNGELDPACRRKFPNPANAFLRLFGLKKFSDYNITGSLEQEMEIDALTGACMLVPKKVVDSVGMLDEQFFFYGEDLDWCYRIKEAGYKIIYFPSAEILHLKWSSSRNIPFKIVKVAHIAMIVFYKKHYAPKYPAPFNWLVYAGIYSRMYLVIMLNVFRSKKSVH
ncbi:MAG: glycosyltransferase family 2 protein [Candidatus Doudnabacteria bacterium]|nr:glycosyltransferase family 2 protein [Candidatus Doudnabacteria bacterium]